MSAESVETLVQAALDEANQESDVEARLASLRHLKERVLELLQEHNNALLPNLQLAAFTRTIHAWLSGALDDAPPLSEPQADEVRRLLTQTTLHSMVYEEPGDSWEVLRSDFSIGAWRALMEREHNYYKQREELNVSWEPDQTLLQPYSDIAFEYTLDTIIQSAITHIASTIPTTLPNPALFFYVATLAFPREGLCDELLGLNFSIEPDDETRRWWRQEETR
ncbi:MAG: hypothetical protein CMH57_00240 [Myxococcales bacterium]|nr:hypothetical protein [Myxococcales bacterium]